MAARRVTASFSAYCVKHCLRPTRRGYCTQKAPDLLNIPLSKPLPGIPAPKYVTTQRESSETKVTTLENGLRVASENVASSFCTVGVLVDSGSRYEVNHPSGITHFLEKLSFGSTDKFANRDEIMQSLENVGGIFEGQGSRDTMVYAISATTSGAEQAIEVLSEVSLRPKVTDQEVEDAALAIQYELHNLDMSAEPEPLMVELYHSAAYKDNTVGLARFTPIENIPKMTRSDIFSYLRTYHTPERTVLAGVGLEHDYLVDLAQRYFVNKTPSWAEPIPGVIDIKADASIAQYTGGIIKVEKDMSIFATGPSPMPNLVHAVIGLESCSHRDEDFIPFCVLQSMMGGGGSFSAGGPGKGMFTRLYTNVLNRHGFLWNATAMNHVYNDCGTFCISASGEPTRLRHMMEIIMRELVSLKDGVGSTELSRAKKQLQSVMFMNLEFLPVRFEDIGKQVLANSVRHTAKYYKEKIEQVGEEDIVRVARRMLASQPSVAVLGDLSGLPLYEEIQAALSDSGSFPKRFQLFR